VRMVTGTGAIYYSTAARADGGLPWDQYVTAREIIRKEYLRLTKQVGVRGCLFRRRDWGDLCDCVDYDTGEPAEPHCSECYGTGIMEGYYSPWAYWLDINNESQKLSRDDSRGMVGDIEVTARAVAYPYPQTNDVWVSTETDRRYFVQAVQVSASVRHKPLILKLQLGLAPETDIVYNLDLEDCGEGGSGYDRPSPCQ